MGGGKRGGRDRNIIMSAYMTSFPIFNILHNHIFSILFTISLKGRGLAAGIPHFNLDRLASNSMASHRLIQHIGKRYGLHVSEALYDRLNV